MNKNFKHTCCAAACKSPYCCSPLPEVEYLQAPFASTSNSSTERATLCAASVK